MVRRADPEPLTIVAAIAGVVGASISAVNYWSTHHGPLPNKVRTRLISRIEKLSTESRYLRSDVDAIEGIFKGAQFATGRTLRFGNGALLTTDEFHRYEHLADQVFGRLKRIQKIALKVQGLAFDLEYIDKKLQVNQTGDAMVRANALIQTRDYSVDKAWTELRILVVDLEKIISQLNKDLDR